ncbi:MAG: phenylacetic acid degradation protein [Rhodospirillaceae bacterium]|nr:phenylacetic acid degradation protein [Rhodospirillaceae bacterium]MBL25475.1 phenylacetic acid degradation protein [Rhodospirillaceae bacterium]
MPENKMTAEELQDRIRQAPFHQWLDLNVTEVTEEDITVSIGWREEFVVNAERGYTHGGILATVIDVAADYALAVKLGRPLPTIDMRVDYHRPAMQGELTAKARVVKLGGSFCTAEAEIFDAAGKLLASGRGVYFSG